MKRVSNVILLSLLTVSCIHRAYAEDMRTFINPGFKIGYAFGESGGFSSGFECSVTWLDGENRVYGVTLAFDGWPGMRRFHLGGECGIKGAGIEWGPSLIVSDSEAHVGHSVTAYVGLFVYPYYTINFVGNDHVIHEFGSYLKLPIKLSGRNFNLGG